MKNQSLYIVTGSSKGIGKALVEVLVKNDSNTVIGISRTAEKSINGDYYCVKLNLGNISEIENKLDRIFPEGDFNRIVLINNAGWIGEINHLGKLSPQNIKSVFDINTIAPAILMNAYVKCYGKISSAEKIVINISSGAANKPMDGWSGYSASKAALNMLTKTAQEEANIEGLNIQYYALSPGVVDTEMQGNIRSANKDGFSALEKFKDMKANNSLSSPEATAQKIIHLITHAEKFQEVLQDVRAF